MELVHALLLGERANSVPRAALSNSASFPAFVIAAGALGAPVSATR